MTDGFWKPDFQKRPPDNGRTGRGEASAHHHATNAKDQSTQSCSAVNLFSQNGILTDSSTSDYSTMTTTMEDVIMNDLSSQDVSTLEQALSDLNNAIVTSDKKQLVVHQEDFLRRGGHVAVVKAMATLSNKPNRQLATEYAIRVLMNASYHNETLRTAIGDAGGMKSILTAMKAYPNERQIQLAGLKAFRNLCHNHASNAESLVARIYVILQVLERFEMDTDIAWIGCKLIARLTVRQETRNILLRANAASTLASIFQRHPDTRHVQESARKAMRLLTVLE